MMPFYCCSGMLTSGSCAMVCVCDMCCLMHQHSNRCTSLILWVHLGWVPHQPANGAAGHDGVGMLCHASYCSPF